MAIPAFISHAITPGGLAAVILGGLIWLHPFSILYAQPRTADASQDPPIEITVNPQISLTRLKSEINKAEDAMFALYNDLNDDDRFDIHCRYVRRWQSKIRERFCSPEFYDTAVEEESEKFMATIGMLGVTPTGPGNARFLRDQAILEEKMKALVEEHPEFREAIGRVNVLKESYEEERQARMGNDE